MHTYEKKAQRLLGKRVHLVELRHDCDERFVCVGEESGLLFRSDDGIFTVGNERFYADNLLGVRGHDIQVMVS